MKLGRAPAISKTFNVPLASHEILFVFLDRINRIIKIFYCQQLEVKG